ncbi:hypothetical protein V6N13_067882 [Hibiscus sabdariffa]|uniref:Uncharacterized protein n=1 Tax=Hibiscus sabdariffa TaxID=183260 RepID=A0ABR2DUT4_9ROSI
MSIIFILQLYNAGYSDIKLSWILGFQIYSSLLRPLVGLYKKLKCTWLLITSPIQRLMDSKASTFEDIVDAYLAYLQVTVANPSMDKALMILQKFAIDAQSGKTLEDKLRFGSPWRHLPPSKDPATCKEWAKIQLMDFVQSLVNAKFGVNYLADCSLEILDDPVAVALVEVGLLYAQRDPSFFRPISKGIQRCLARWLVQERMQLSCQNLLQYLCQRIIRGRSYRHLMLQVGYDKY